MKRFYDLFALLTAYSIGAYIGTMSAKHNHIQWWAWVLIVVLELACFRMINIYADDRAERKLNDRYSR